MKIIDGKKISEKIKQEIATYTSGLKVKPLLAVIQIGDNESSKVYIRNKEKDALEVGIDFKLYKFDEYNNTDEVISLINNLNDDIKVNGIIVQLPIPSSFNKDKIINAINPKKDVDGLTKINMGMLYNGEEAFTPATPKGIIYLLGYEQIDVTSKHVVIVGRSDLVGKPLINLFLTMNATVTICHSKTKKLGEITKMADILVVAVGKKDLINSTMIKDDAIIIDVGINRIDGKLYGDVNFDDVKDRCSYITPVPGGVGPMTRVMLLKNVIISYEKSCE